MEKRRGRLREQKCETLDIFFFNPGLSSLTLSLSFLARSFSPPPSLVARWPKKKRQVKETENGTLQKKTHRLIRSSADPCRCCSSRPSSPPPSSVRSLGGAARGAERFTPRGCCAVAVAGAAAGNTLTLAGLSHTRTHPPASAVTSAPLPGPPPALLPPALPPPADEENATSDSGSECAGAARATAGTKVISEEAGAGAIREAVGEGGDGGDPAVEARRRERRLLALLLFPQPPPPSANIDLAVLPPLPPLPPTVPALGLSGARPAAKSSSGAATSCSPRQQSCAPTARRYEREIDDAEFEVEEEAPPPSTTPPPRGSNASAETHDSAPLAQARPQRSSPRAKTAAESSSPPAAIAAPSGDLVGFC